jgi:hypothetical protein
VRWRKGTGHRSSSLSLLRARSIPRHQARSGPRTTPSYSKLPLRDRLLHRLPIPPCALGRRWPLRQVVAHPDSDDCISLVETASTSSTASLHRSPSTPHSSYGAPMAADRVGLGCRGRSRTGRHECAAALCRQPQLR